MHGKGLDNPKHTDHKKPYVQDYLNKYGAWKCEANSIVVRPTQGRQIFQDALNPFIDFDGVERYWADIEEGRNKIKLALPAYLAKQIDELEQALGNGDTDV